MVDRETERERERYSTMTTIAFIKARVSHKTSLRMKHCLVLLYNFYEGEQRERGVEGFTTHREWTVVAVT